MKDNKVNRRKFIGVSFLAVAAVAVGVSTVPTLAGVVYCDAYWLARKRCFVLVEVIYENGKHAMAQTEVNMKQMKDEVVSVDDACSLSQSMYPSDKRRREYKQMT